LAVPLALAMLRTLVPHVARRVQLHVARLGVVLTLLVCSLRLGLPVGAERGLLLRVRPAALAWRLAAA